MTQDTGALAPGDMLHDTYRIDRLLGIGGTGEVYAATNTVSRKACAIKILKPELSRDPNFIELLRRELVRDIRSDAVVRYYDLLRSETLGGLHYLVMEYIDGPPLADVMQARGPLPPADLLQIARRAAEGLEAAHAQRVFHRDIAPDNILLKDGRAEGAVLIDFGIAKDVTPDAGTVIGGGFAGKYEYAAPEQLEGSADAQSDIYALGATLLAAARGEAPRMPTALSEIFAIKRAPVDVSDQPEPLRGLLAGMLAPDRADRFADAGALRRAVEAAAAGASPPAPAAAPPALGGAGETPPQPRPGRAPALAAAAPARGEADRRDAPKRADASSPARKGGSGGPIALAAVGALALAGAGWWFLLGPGAGPSYDPVAVWRLEAAAGEGETPELAGHAPSEESRTALVAAAREAGVAGAAPGDLALASGAPSDAWPEAGAGLLAAAAPLDGWRLRVIGSRALLIGRTGDQDALTAAETRAEAAAAVAGLALDLRLSLERPGPDVPALEAQLAEVLEGLRSCGPLEAEVPWERLADGARPRLSGRVADTVRLQGLVDAVGRVLARAGGGAPSVEDVQVLNPAVCRVLDLLPPTAPPAGLDFAAVHPETGAALALDALPPGVPPVISLAVPGTAPDHVQIFIVDDDGGVFHLVPAPSRPDGAVEAVATAEIDGRRAVEISLAPDDPGFPSRGIPVLWIDPKQDRDGATLMRDGKPVYADNVLVAILSETPLWEEPFASEHVNAFAPRLAKELAEAERRGESVGHVERLVRVRVPR